MKKLFLGLFLIFGLTIGLLNVIVSAEGETTSYTLTINYSVPDQTVDPFIIPGNSYGQLVTVDAPSREGFEFAGIVVDGKVSEGLTKSFRIYEDTQATVYYKPLNTKVVIVKDSNDDSLLVLYTGTDGVLSSSDQGLVSGLTNPTKPGLSFSSWSVSNFSTAFTQDTIVYPIFTTNIDDLGLTITNGEASVVGPYSFNQVVTVTANGTGTFNYWLKDGLIASLDQTYTFTMAGSHDLEAVYNSDFVANTGSFIGISNVYDNLRDGYYTVIGNIDLATGEELVEWGIITSNLPGGITLDTPGVVKYNSNKLNSGTNEFVMSFAKNTEVPNYRAFVTTINGTTVKTYYSYYLESNLANDLIISEYIEGSGTTRAIEIYNGTGYDVDLSNYMITNFYNGNTTVTEAYSYTFSGTLKHNETFVLYHTSSVPAVIAASKTADLYFGSANNYINFNGNDCIVLKKGEVVVDSIGKLGVDPGSAWSSNGVSTANMTLVRKSSILSGDTIPNDEFNPSLEWDAFPTDTATYLGKHDMDLVKIYTTSVIPNSIVINGVATLSAGNTKQLSITYPVNTAEGVVWSSSNETVLTVSETGLVTAVSEGSATITAYSFYNHSVVDTIEITVVPANTEYTVTYNLDGGTNDVSNPTTFVAGDLPITLEAPTKENYIFDGWYTESSHTNKVTQLTLSQEYDLYAKWAQASSIFSVRALTAPATVDYIEGIVTGLSGTTQNVYINDGTAAIVARDAALYGAVTVGDKVRLKTSTLGTYNGLLQLTGFTYEKLSSGNALPSTISIANLSVLTSAYQAQRISIDGLEVVSISGQNLIVTDGTTQIIVRSALSSGTIYDHLNTAIVGQTVNLVDIHVGWFNAVQVDPINVSEVVFVTFSDADLIQMDADALPASLELTADYVVPTPANGSTYTVTAVSTALQANIDYTTTPGTLLVTRPAVGNPDLVGTVTIRVTLGEETPIDVVINVIVKAMTESGSYVEQLVYSTGFESTEDFTASTSYDNTMIKYTGPTGQQWGTYYGTPSTTGPITGLQSMQMRWYSTAPTNYGYTFMNFDISKATKITFKALNTSGNNVKVEYSTDGGATWINPQTFTLSTTAALFTYNISATGEYSNVRIKFTMVPGTTSKSRVTIDDIAIYGMVPEV
jgi:uncharacterized repeat protein (TIGR02543 family)